nr:DUF1801 domain-containing protein [Candidatus Acidoferrales bacterium]
MAVRRPIPELLKFLSAYDKRIAKLALEVRSAVLTAAPDATEAIYDAYNAVAIGYSFTGRLKESFIHVAVYAPHVNLGFNRGAEMDDPEGVLLGDCKMVRHLTICEPADLKKKYIGRLLRDAVLDGRAMAATSKVPTIPPQSVVKAIYAKRRRPVRE